MTIEAAAATSAPDQRTAALQAARAPERLPRERRPREKPRLLIPAIVVAVGSYLLGLLELVLIGRAGLRLQEGTMDDPALSSLAGQAAAMLGVQGVLALCLIGSGVGLLLRKPWGWWGATLMYAALLVLSLKMMTPILHINWGHPDALEAALIVFLGNGLPIPAAVPMLVLLFLPSMRLAYGVKQAGYERHRPLGRPHGEPRG